jgi:hypothetical protein
LSDLKSIVDFSDNQVNTTNFEMMVQNEGCDNDDDEENGGNIKAGNISIVLFPLILCLLVKAN